MENQLNIDELFDPEFLQALQHFKLIFPKVDKGGRLAEQKSSARGQGLEYVDYKPYVAGDDLRAIDWNIYQRLGKLFVKVFEEKQDLPVNFLVDTSSSMFLGRDPKIKVAAKAILALSSICLGQHDSVGLYSFSDDFEIKVKSMSGKGNLMRFAQHICNLPVGRGTELTEAIEQLSAVRLRRGLVVIVSDFFDEAGIDAVLESLQKLRHRVLLLQLVHPEDRNPELIPEMIGDVEVEDSETGSRISLTLDRSVFERYQKVWNEFNDKLTSFSEDYGVGYIQLDTSEDIIEQLSCLFKNGGVIQ